MKKILILSREFPPGPGGIGTQAYYLAKILKAQGYEITVICSQGYAPEKEIEGFNNSQIFKIIRLHKTFPRFLKYLKGFLLVSRMIKNLAPDVIIASGDLMVYLAAAMSLKHKIRWIAIEHGNIPSFSLEFFIKRFALIRAAAVVCVSNYIQKQLEDRGYKIRKYKVIHNGVDRDLFRVLWHNETQELKRNLGLEKSRILLTVGNLTWRKGQDIVIKALPYILKEFPDTHYLIAGLPTNKEKLIHIAKGLCVENRVHFLGVVDKNLLVNLYNCCDIFVMTSRHVKYEFEGYGIAVAEAALCGKPAVVAKNCGLTEAIAEGETGLVVPENDEINTAKAVISLFKDDAFRIKMGENALKRAQREQRWEQRVAEYEALFKDILLEE